MLIGQTKWIAAAALLLTGCAPIHVQIVNDQDLPVHLVISGTGKCSRIEGDLKERANLALECRLADISAVSIQRSGEAKCDLDIAEAMRVARARSEASRWPKGNGSILLSQLPCR